MNNPIIIIIIIIIIITAVSPKTYCVYLHNFNQNL